MATLVELSVEDWVVVLIEPATFILPFVDMLPLTVKLLFIETSFNTDNFCEIIVFAIVAVPVNVGDAIVA